jgi:hypothetical protein
MFSLFRIGFNEDCSERMEMPKPNYLQMVDDIILIFHSMSILGKQKTRVNLIKKLSSKKANSD